MILAGHDWRERAQPFDRCGFLIKRWGTEYVALQTENLAIHDFGVKDFVALLKPPNSCHICAD